MEVLQEDNGKKGKFYILENDNQEAEMTYTWAGTERIIMDHTEVNEVLKGKNAGKQMVMKAVDFARARGIKIIPLCPFVNSVFQKIPEIQDVL
ncbi:MAG: GNAT family N-acetyltransferase [Bacteroidota bacterium]|nr:GNAT family N-acetyltransferase [Bacteroidota bacterium]